MTVRSQFRTDEDIAMAVPVFHNIRRGLALIAFLAISGLVSAYGLVTAAAIEHRVDGILEWDPYRNEGVLVAGNNQLTFRPGDSSGVLNDRKRITLGAVVRGSQGGLLFSEQGAGAIERALGLAQLTVNGGTSVSSPRIAAIIIDPGHGGKDPGTIHDPFSGRSIYSHLMEKNIVLQVGLDVDKLLKSHFRNIRIIMTRKRDVFVTLARRAEIANDVKLKPNESKIFISIHANASFDREANGFEVWYLPPTYRRDVLPYTSLSPSSKLLYPILNAMREEEYTIQSSLLGEDILRGMSSTVGRQETDRGLKAQDWFVVRNSKMPAVLVEVGFVSNKTEAKLLGRRTFLQRIAQGIYDGIKSFVTKYDDKQ